MAVGHAAQKLVWDCPTTDYIAGNTLQTVSSAEGSTFTLMVDTALVGSAVTWGCDFCEDGSGTRDCIGESVEFMIFVVNMLDGPVQMTS